jgi:hypothetical protein
LKEGDQAEWLNEKLKITKHSELGPVLYTYPTQNIFMFLKSLWYKWPNEILAKIIGEKMGK